MASMIGSGLVVAERVRYWISYVQFGLVAATYFVVAGDEIMGFSKGSIILFGVVGMGMLAIIDWFFILPRVQRTYFEKNPLLCEILERVKRIEGTEDVVE